jgi:leucyl aminopeptidase
MLDVSFTKTTDDISGAVVIGMGEEMILSQYARRLNETAQDALQRAIESSRFCGKSGEIVSLIAPAAPDISHILLVGLGKKEDLTDIEAQNIGGKICAELNALKVKSATLVMDLQKPVETSAHLCHGANLRSYRFDKYKTKEDSDKKPTLTSLTVTLNSAEEAEAHYAMLESVAKGVFIARDVVSEPPNKLHPESYAETIKKRLGSVGVSVKILGENQMKKLGMGALLGVGQGSVRESQLVVMEWKGDKKNKEAPIAFVGKGVTFDTGGISLKPSQGMEDMKYDMGGSAAVVGVMKALAARKAKVNAIGVVGLVENMPDGNAQRPSDVVTSMSGQTIAVLNTDAEGRLVLADALTYCQETFKPHTVVNLATLTGAIVVALGNEHAGLFSNSDKLSEQLANAGNDTNEKLWRFPMHKNYDKMIDSEIADIQNISSGRGAGSITAAQFLQRFIKEDVNWAHLDIAGMAWEDKGQDVCPKGATGFGVRLLDRLVKDYYEAK